MLTIIKYYNIRLFKCTTLNYFNVRQTFNVRKFVAFQVKILSALKLLNAEQFV